MTGGDEKVFTPSIVWSPAVRTTVLSSRDREILPFSPVAGDFQAGIQKDVPGCPANRRDYALQCLLDVFQSLLGLVRRILGNGRIFF